MYALVEIAGQQFKVEKKQEIFVHRLEEKEGSKVDFSDVLLIDNNGKVNVGTPVIKGAVVSAKVLEHMKADKVLVFKKKRRKGYQKLTGHRQYMSRIVIENILEKAPKAAAPKAEKEEKPATKATTAKKETASNAKPKTVAKPKTAAKPKAKKPASAKATAGEEVKKAAPKAAKPAAKAETKKAAPKTASKKAAPKKESSPKAEPKAKKADEKKEDK